MPILVVQLLMRILVAAGATEIYNENYYLIKPSNLSGLEVGFTWFYWILGLKISINFLQIQTLISYTSKHEET